MKLFTKTSVARLRLIIGVVLVTAIFAYLLLYRLGSLPGGLSDNEVAMQHTINSWGQIAQNPLMLPFKLVQYLIFTVASNTNQAVVRLPSVIFGALALIGFARVVRWWYGYRVMLLALPLFGMSAWFLHVSRLATTDVVYLWATTLLMAVGVYLQRANNKALIFYGSVLALSLLLYIPGMVWLVAIAAIWHWSYFADGWRHFSKWWQRSLWLLLLAASNALLAYAFIRTPSLLKSWAGLPAHLDTPVAIARNFADVFINIFVRGAHQPEIWLGSLPAVNVFVAIMFVVGAYFYARHWRAPRSRMLLALITVGAILVALAGAVSLSIIMPVIYLVAAAGIGYLLHDWLSVFPRNPLARKSGILLVALAVAFSCLYGVRQYFVAWPHNPAVNSTFRNR